jgi:hypothetical protein
MLGLHLHNCGQQQVAVHKFEPKYSTPASIAYIYLPILKVELVARL